MYNISGHNPSRVLLYVAGFPQWLNPPEMETVLDGRTSGERGYVGDPLDHWRKYLYENSPVGIAVAGLNGRFRMANFAYQKMMGYTEAELLELTFLDLAIEADRPAARARLSQLAKGAVRQCQEEKRCRRKDGSLICVRATLTPVRGDPGSPPYVLAIAEDITERNRAEEALRESEARYRELFENAQLGIYRSTPGGRIVVANPSLVAMLGYTSLEELQQRNLESEGFEPGYDRGSFKDVLERDGTIRNHNAIWTRRGGGTLYVLESAVAVRDSEGAVLYYDGTVQDITEHRCAEAALRESEERFRELTEHIREVLWIVDHKAQRVLYVSPAYERIWGRPREGLYRDMGFIDAIHPDDRQGFLDGYEKQVRCRTPDEKKYRVIRPDGSIRWIQDRSFPILDAAGGVRRFVGIAEDITTRRQAEQTLRRSQAYLAESERLGHIGSWAFDVPDRKITFWSPEEYRIFGFDPEKGPPTFEAFQARVHPADSAALDARNRALAEKKDFDLNYRILHPDGSVRYIHSLGHPVLDDAGEPTEFSGITMDVTAHRLAELALERSLAQHRALAARLESIREEERKGCARAIHDELGQALTGIKIDLSSLSHYPPRRPERAKKWQAVLNQIDAAIQSVQRISTELRPGMLDDLGLAAAVEWEAQEFARRTGMKYALELPREDLAIKPEVSTALFRILQEALTNIARHAEATEFSVRLAEDDGGLLLEVRDNGKGFDEARLPQNRLLGFLGMRERASLLAGRLTIGSSPGKGATVTVWIPGRRKKRLPNGD
jgi:PAS domain S-box-containing protein